MTGPCQGEYSYKPADSKPCIEVALEKIDMACYLCTSKLLDYVNNLIIDSCPFLSDPGPIIVYPCEVSVTD